MFPLQLTKIILVILTFVVPQFALIQVDDICKSSLSLLPFTSLTTLTCTDVIEEGLVVRDDEESFLVSLQVIVKPDHGVKI